MIINSQFAPGDKAWCFDGDQAAHQLTVGQVRVIVTKSPGTGPTMFSNYKPQKGYDEEYMCVETGIGSGSVYTLNKSIFATEAECLAANSKRIADAKKAAKELRQWDIRRAKESLERAQSELRKLGEKA